MSSNTVYFKFGDSLYSDVENLITFIQDLGIDEYCKPPISNAIDSILKNELKRRIENNNSKIKTDNIDYKERSRVLFDWLCFYQDKCLQLEGRNPIKP